MRRNILIAILFTLILTGHAQQTEVKYLSGHGPEDAVLWDFWCSDGQRSGKWGKIAVPSCWEQQGYGGYTYGRYYIYKERAKSIPFADYREHEFHDEQGRYRHRFTVPREWQGRQVSIVFDAVMTDAEVFVNGQKAGPTHQGAFYQFSYDISQLLQYGKKNLLEVNVWKQSQDRSVNAAERRADWWLFGGIYRPVWLECKPQAHISHVAVDARADGTLNAWMELQNAPDGAKVEVELTDNKSLLKVLAKASDQGRAQGSTFKVQGSRSNVLSRPSSLGTRSTLISTVPPSACCRKTIRCCMRRQSASVSAPLSSAHRMVSTSTV